MKGCHTNTIKKLREEYYDAQKALDDAKSRRKGYVEKEYLDLVMRLIGPLPSELSKVFNFQYSYDDNDDKVLLHGLSSEHNCTYVVSGECFFCNFSSLGVLKVFRSCIYVDQIPNKHYGLKILKIDTFQTELNIKIKSPDGEKSDYLIPLIEASLGHFVGLTRKTKQLSDEIEKIHYWIYDQNNLYPEIRSNCMLFLWASQNSFGVLKFIQKDVTKLICRLVMSTIKISNPKIESPEPIRSYSPGDYNSD
jgi:hypothetical protein